MTETKRCIPCVEKKLRQLYQRERNKTEMYRRRIDALEAERDRLRYTIDLLNSFVHKLPDKNPDLQKEVERVMAALLPGEG